MRVHTIRIALLVLLINTTFFACSPSALKIDHGRQTSFDGHLHYLVGPEKGKDDDCLTTKKYFYDYPYAGNYQNFSVLIHSQVKLDNLYFSANEIAHLNSVIYQTALKKFGSNKDLDPKKFQELKNYLQDVHIIVAVDEEHLHNLWADGNEKDLTYIARTTITEDACFSHQNKTWFYTILRSRFLKHDIDTMVHEAMHIVSFVLFGDKDVDHVDPRFWDELDERNSLQQLSENSWYQKLYTCQQ